MDKVLIVDGDRQFLGNLKNGLDKLQQFHVQTAADGTEAMAVLAAQPISVLVTDIETPGQDSLELLAHMTRKHPRTPCIVMTDQGKPWFKRRLAQQSFLYHLEKPFEINKLAAAIFVGLNLRDEGENMAGMTMQSLLPLIEIQQKTCRMKVKAEKGQNGFLYFKDGELFDAHYHDLNGEAAAVEIATWSRIAIKISELPRHRTRMRVKSKLMDIAGASWTRPETEPLAEETEADWQALLDLTLTDIRTEAGFKAACLLDLNGALLASEAPDPATAIEPMAPDLFTVYTHARETLQRIQLKHVKALTLYTEDHAIRIQLLEAPDGRLVCVMIMGDGQSDWPGIESKPENPRLPHTN